MNTDERSSGEYWMTTEERSSGEYWMTTEERSSGEYLNISKFPDICYRKSEKEIPCIERYEPRKI